MLRRVIFSIALYLLSSGLISGLQAKHWTITNYTAAEGLPFSQINSVVQDHEGYLWFAGSGGILKYDGEKFHSKIASRDLKAERYIKISSFGDMIFALPPSSGSRIIYFINSHKFALPPVTPHDEKFVLTDFAIDTADNSFKISVATDGSGLFIFQKGQWKNRTIGDSTPDNSIIFLKKYGNLLYAGTKKGLFVLNGDSSMKCSFHDQLPGEGIVMKLIKTDQNTDDETYYLLGIDWLGRVRDNEFELINNDFNLLKTANPENTYFGYTDDDYLFFGNEFVTYSYDLKAGTLTSLGDKDGLVTTGATDILVDRENNVWLTSYRGINKLVLRNFDNVSSEDGLLEDEVTAITRYGEDDVFLGHSNGLTVVNGDDMRAYKTISWQSSLLNGRVLDAAADNNGNVYFVCQNMGLGVLNPRSDNIRWLTGKDDYRFNSVLTDNDKILLGAENGLYSFEKGKIIKTIPYDIYVRKIYKGRGDEIALCTKYDGIVKLKDGELVSIKGGTKKSNNIYSYHYNDVELAGTAAGLYYIDEGRLEKYNKDGFKIDRPVYFIGEDKAGGVWFGTDAGVYYKKEKQVYRYSTCNGLAGLETNRSAFYTDKENKIYIGTNSGLSSTFIEDLITGSPNVAAIRFRYMEDSEGNTYSLTSNVSTSTNEFIVKFDALSYKSDKKKSFSVQLIDLKGGTATEQTIDRTEFRVTNLEPGSYCVKLKFADECVTDTSVYKSSIIKITPSPESDLMIFAALFVITGLVTFVSAGIARKWQKKNGKVIVRGNPERKYKDISQQILMNYENEKAELSNNLRDGLAQILAGVNYRFDLIGAKTGYKDQNFNEVLSEMTLVRKELLKIINGLHPVEIERYGLKASLENLFDKFAAEHRGKKEIIYTINLPDETNRSDILIYRILEYFVVFLLKNFTFKSLETVINYSSDFVHVRLNSDSDIFSQFNTPDRLDNDIRNKYKRFKTLIEIANGYAAINNKEGNYTFTIPV